jgi:cysteine desulfurase
METPCIYLDHHATTPTDPRVVEAMLPWFTTKFGNAGSVNHPFGIEAREAVEQARASLAEMIGASPKEIVFTSGATESNNLALKGLAGLQRRRGNHLVGVVTEHRAVLDPLARLARRGFDLTLLPVDEHGFLTADAVAGALREDTLVCSVMLANNEIGTIQPISEIARVCRSSGVFFHCDATQAVGKMAVNVESLGVDLLSFSAHKIYGPKGVGALFVRRKAPHVRLEPLFDGGGQEFGLRSGTLAVPLIIGFAKALELCIAEMDVERSRLRGLRDNLYQRLLQQVLRLKLNGPPLDAAESRLAGNLNVSFADVDGEALMMNMRRIAVSSGSACTSTNPEPSHVLRALGIGDDLTRASLRFGIGRSNTAADIDIAVEEVVHAVERLRNLMA